MPLRLSSATVVVLAQQMNPSIFTQLWVAKTLGVPEDAFKTSGAAYTPHVSSIPTNDFHLMVLPDRLQFTPTVDISDQGQLVLDKVKTIVTSLPHTPFNAVGMNFDWQLLTDAKENCTASRKLFFNPDHWMFKEFSAPDACFGAYFSKDFLGMRFTLDVKPVKTSDTPDFSGDKKEFFMNFSFNCNLFLSGEDRPQQIVSVVEKWDKAKTEAERLAKLAELHVSS
jgi:hypothetical protein